MKKLAVLFSGTGTNLAYILKHLHKQNGYEVVLAISNNPNAKGIKIAQDYGVDVKIIDNKNYSSREDFDQQLVQSLDKVSPDLTVLAGFMRILTIVFTDNIKSINLHPSLLPKYKGIKAIERSYDSDDKVGGVSVHWVNSELDGGEIILQKSFEKYNGMIFDKFEEKIKIIEKEALKEAIIKVL